MSSLFGGEVEMKARLELGQVFETARPQGLTPPISPPPIFAAYFA
jgi:hypothetical protein